MIGQFVAVLFLARELAHREHLRVLGPGSYSTHMALGDFYSSVGDLADKLTEAYQGRTGEIVEIEFLSVPPKQEIVPTLESQLKWLEDNRYQAVSEDDSPLQNIVDEVCALYLSTLYKLKNLK